MSPAILNLGKVDYNGTGRKINKVTIEIGLTDDRLSICGNVWNGPCTDIVSGGQNYDTIQALFPDDLTVQRIVEVWKRWHLNDTRAGTWAQRAVLSANKDDYPGFPASYYDWACELLDRNGLLVDKSDPTKPYRYGSGWLVEELPAEIRAEVQGWIDEAK